jgi:hypothetical protein
MRQAYRPGSPVTGCRWATASLSDGPYHFVKKLAQRRGIQHLFGQQLLRLGVLVPEVPQPLSLGLPSRRTSPSIVQRRFGDAMLPRQIDSLPACLMLTQHANNALFRKPGSLQLSVFQNDLRPPNWTIFG